MKTKLILIFFLSVMAVMVVLALVFPDEVKGFLNRPALYPHVLFAHILTTTLFFANAVIGMLWEFRSLASKRSEVILHNYRTVAWLDARLSSPLIVLSVVTGIMLTVMYGEMRQIGWLTLAFILFVFSGVVWVASDIPTQYRVKKLVAEVKPEDEVLPEELMRLLKLRLWVSSAGVIPLIIVFLLMVYKPGIPPIGEWFG